MQNYLSEKYYIFSNESYGKIVTTFVFGISLPYRIIKWNSQLSSTDPIAR